MFLTVGTEPGPEPATSLRRGRSRPLPGRRPIVIRDVHEIGNGLAGAESSTKVVEAVPERHEFTELNPLPGQIGNKVRVVRLGQRELDIPAYEFRGKSIQGMW